jgi:hypothetical protein
MNEWIKINESLWLFFLIGSELVVGLCTFVLLILEYIYDKEWNENRARKRRVTKNKVKVIIDKEGNARIAESPKDVDISIEHEGEQK